MDDTSEFATGIASRTVIDWKQQAGGSNLRPRITLRDKDGEVINLPNGLRSTVLYVYECNFECRKRKYGKGWVCFSKDTKRKF